MIIGDSFAGPVDRGRQLVNIAINAGRSYQSAQTGFVHICYRQLDEDRADTIPLYENYLFALALLRERTSESIGEAKSLFSKLLNFQNFFEESSQGNFPVYIHEYPRCNDAYLPAKLLPIFYWTLRNFYLVIGTELREQLAMAASTMLGYLEQLDQKRIPFLTALRYAAAQHAFGKLWEQPAMVEQGQTSLLALSKRWQECPYPSCFRPQALGDTLLALQLVYTQFEGSPWQALWRQSMQLWHTPTGSYCGPAWEQWQHKQEPEVTVLDWILGFHAPNLSYRAFTNGPHLLECALIHPTDDSFIVDESLATCDGTACQRAWHVVKQPQYAWSVLEKDQPRPARDNGYASFHLVWGDLNGTHSCVVQGGTAEQVRYESVEGGVDLLFSLPKEVPSEAGRKNRELQLYLDHTEDAQIHVQGLQAATTFQLGETAVFSSAGVQIHVTALLEEGQGKFFGHIARGNRPSQRACTGEARFLSYDWQLFLRTLERDASCSIRLQLRINEERTKL